MTMAIDPPMHRHLGRAALPHTVRELGFDGIMPSSFAGGGKADQFGTVMRAGTQRSADRHRNAA